MRIVFFGTPELAVPSLEALCNHHDVVAVVCQPDRPAGRKKQLQPPPTKQWALAHDLPVHQPTKLNDGTFEVWLKEQVPDICVLVAYGRILKQPILDVPPQGFLNMHPSMLPKYRGPSPLQSAVLNGDTETGITIMRLDAGMDSGDVLLQESMPIAPEDTSGTLHDRAAEKGAELLLGALALVESGEPQFTPQDDARATYTHLFKKADGRIRWSESAESIHHLVRAANPWPSAQCQLQGKTLRIHETSFDNDAASGDPGSVIRVEDDQVVVATGKGHIAIHVLQNPGKRALPVAEYLRGNPIQVGEHFEEN